ncbi:hypothetical protein GCM10023306_15700 [Novosphingobium ginsenosidimutans]
MIGDEGNGLACIQAVWDHRRKCGERFNPAVLANDHLECRESLRGKSRQTPHDICSVAEPNQADDYFILAVHTGP